MQLDNELKRRVSAAAESLPVATEEAYASVLERGRRGFERPLAWGLAGIGLAVAVWLGMGVLATEDRPAPRPPAGSTPLEGPFTTQIDRGGRAARVYDLEGSWRLDFDGRGRVTASVPLGFVRKIGTPPTADAIVDGDLLTTDLFSHAALGCGEPGTYRWTVSNGLLTFEEVEDSCPYRPAILTGGNWIATE